MTEVNDLLNPLSKLDFGNFNPDNFNFKLDDSYCDKKKLNQLIEDKVVVTLYGNSEIMNDFEYGIIIRYNSELLYFLSDNMDFYIFSIKYITNIYKNDNLKTYVFSEKLKILNEKNSIFNDPKFMMDIPIEVKSQVKKYLGYQNLEEEFFDRLNLPLIELLRIIKNLNYIIFLGSARHDRILSSKIISVEENLLELCILDFNEVFISENYKIKYDEIYYFSFEIFNNFYDNIMFENKNEDKLNKVIKKIMPGYSFVNKFIENKWNEWDNHNFYFIKNNKREVKISENYINQIKFLAEHIDILGPDIFYDLNSENFEEVLNKYTLFLKNSFNEIEFKSKFQLTKLTFINVNEFDLNNKLNFNEVLILHESDTVLLVQDMSFFNEGYFLINKSYIKERFQIYSHEFRKKLIEKRNIILPEIKEALENGTNIFKVLENKFCTIRTHNENFPRNFYNVRVFVEKVEEESYNFEGKTIVLDYVLFPKKHQFEFKNFFSINFGSASINEHKESYDLIKSNKILDKYKNINDQVQKLITDKIKPYQQYFNNWCIIYFDFTDSYIEINIFDQCTKKTLSIDAKIDEYNNVNEVYSMFENRHYDELSDSEDLSD